MVYRNCVGVLLSAAFCAWGQGARAALMTKVEVAEADASDLVSGMTTPVADFVVPASVAADTVALTTVEELTDVSPGHWAYSALQNLVETYGCIEGYPDGTFRGDRFVSRYEFAALLDTCLSVVSSLAAAGQVSEADLATLQRLQAEYGQELAALTSRIEALEVETATLQANTFSTTTRLRGEVVFSLEQLAGGDQANGSGEDLPEALVFGSRARLNFDTSFTGRDLLKVRLDALDPNRFTAPVTGTNMTRLAFDRANNNSFDIGKLFYRFPVSDRFSLQIDAGRGAYQANVSSTFNPGLASPITGVVSRFGRFNPLYYQGALGTGITGVYDIAPNPTLSAGYLSRLPGANNPNEGGLFGSGYTALAQLDYRPTDTLGLGLVYARSYYPAGGDRGLGGHRQSAGQCALWWECGDLGQSFWPPVQPQVGIGQSIGLGRIELSDRRIRRGSGEPWRCGYRAELGRDAGPAKFRRARQFGRFSIRQSAASVEQ